MARPSLLQRVLVRLVCRNCRWPSELCLAVNIVVPRPLRCSPAGAPAAGSGSSSGLRCRKCALAFGLTDDELARRVEEELRRGRQQHISAGAVVIDTRC